VSERFFILIADRNRNVREFMKRELMAEGYRVRVARDDREVLEAVESSDPPALVILDPEIPYGGALEVVETLGMRKPGLPIVIHSLSREDTLHPSLKRVAAFVEKSGNMEHLKETLASVLHHRYRAKSTA